MDLAARARVSRTQVSDLELGHAERLSLPAARRIAATVDIRLGWDIGAIRVELARLRDADHAAIAEHLVRLLVSDGWLVLPEASYNHFGERGRIDLLAYHPGDRTLLVIEVKTLLIDVQDLLGNLDVKVRLAGGVARSRGWRPEVVVPLLAVLEGTTNRRHLAAHVGLFARFKVRGRSALSWLRGTTARRAEASGLLLFVQLPSVGRGGISRAGRRRMRPKSNLGSIDRA